MPSHRSEQKISYTNSDRRAPSEIERHLMRALFETINGHIQTSSRFYDPDDNEYDRHSVRGRSSFQLSSEQKIMGRHGKATRDFSKAMKFLHKQVGKAEEFYNGFIGDFDNDVENIRGYAGQGLLKELWMNKVKNKKQSEDEETYKEKFAKQGDLLLRAMREAVNADLYKNETRGSHDEANRERDDLAEALRQKVSMHCIQMDVLLKCTPDKHSCRRLLADLKLLKEAVDPGSELNKDLFRGSGNDEGEEEGVGSNSGESRNWEEE